jgi:tripartite-type tricarboxylate transporter receptor subunit TctC
MLTRRALMIAPAAAAAGDGSAFAQAYPTGPIRLIVPFSAGGPADLIARILAERVAVELGQPMVVENRVGGNFVVGTQAAARARPDGYTIMIVTGANLIVSLTQENLPYNLDRDLAPVLGIGSFPILIAVPGRSNIRSIADLAAIARATEGGLTYGSGGVGSVGHLAVANLLGQLGVTGTHVPYRGNNEATQALLSNQIQLFLPTIADAYQFVASSGVRALGVTSDRRLESLPDVPTTKELGLPDFTARIWYGYLAPTGTPAAAIARLRDAFTRAIEHPPIQRRLAAMHYNAEVTGAEEFARFMQAEAKRWGGVIRANRITLNN